MTVLERVFGVMKWVLDTDACNRGVYDDSHHWHEFGDNEWKCTRCGLVVGWPQDDTAQEMGVL